MLQRYALLDLAPVVEGGTPAQAFVNAADLARRAEHWGYTRYWLAEHHNMPGIASAATAVLIGHVAAATESIRVGAGGIMLPNHSPLVIAEQFGTLASLYPERIDLGLGRAPGSDMVTARALRRASTSNPDQFPRDVMELIQLLGDAEPGQAVRAVPGEGTHVPVWILGSSLFGAQLAAALGLPYAFASHFAPEALIEALRVYRENFKPSAQLAEPYTMAGLNVYIAASDDAARHLFTSAQIQFTNLFRGAPGRLQPPIDDIDAYWTPAERGGVERALRYAVVGSAESARERIANFVAETGVDEVMLTSQIHDHDARCRSFEHAATLCSELITTGGEAAAAG